MGYHGKSGDNYISDTEEDENSSGNAMNELTLNDFSSREVAELVLPEELGFINDHPEQNVSSVILWLKLTLEEFARHIEEYGSIR